MYNLFFRFLEGEIYLVENFRRISGSNFHKDFENNYCRLNTQNCTFFNLSNFEYISKKFVFNFEKALLMSKK